MSAEVNDWVGDFKLLYFAKTIGIDMVKNRNAQN